MRRAVVLFACVAFGLVSFAFAARASHAVGAEAGTPSAEEIGPPEGVAFEALAYGPVTEFPPVPAFAVIEHLTFDPGAILPADPEGASLSFLYIESGELTIRADAAISVTRADALAMAFASGEFPILEEISAGTDGTLGAGDSVALPPLFGVEFRNDGTDAVVALAVNIAPVG